jgi:Na+/H+ antiporter NhaD/arsenite permease-like protein
VSMLALLIFALTYLLILAGENSPRKLDRPAAGLLGGVLMVATGVLTRREAAQGIDFGTLGLLFGMMVVIGFFVRCGLLDACAAALLRRSRSPRHLLWVIALSAGALSALLVNDTICLLMTPLVLAITARARLPAEPYLIALATSSNAGSVMTLTGNPQNMLIGQASGWGWGPFALRMVPLGLLCLAVNGLVIIALYRRHLGKRPLQIDPIPARPIQRRLAIKTVVVLTGLILAFLAGAPMDVSALLAAVTLLVLANEPPARAFAEVDWSLLIFFAGLFVVVEGVTHAEGGWIARLAPLFTRHTASFAGLAGFCALATLGSNLFSNVPFVMLLRPWLAHVPHAPLAWLALASASTLAGNLTLLGSVANMIVAQGAREACPLGFWEFARVGVLTTLLTVAATVLVLWLYAQWGWV